MEVTPLTFDRFLQNALFGDVSIYRHADGSRRAVKSIAKAQLRAGRTADGLRVREDAVHELELLALLRGCPQRNLLNLAPFSEQRETASHILVSVPFAEGGDLFTHICNNAQSGLGERGTRQLLRGLVRGVMHLHKLGYVHRDISPENVLLFRDPSAAHGSAPRTRFGSSGLGFTPVLCDFGLAASYHRDAQPPASLNQDFPALSIARRCPLPSELPYQGREQLFRGRIGKTTYMAPEVYQGLTYNGRHADVYSLGAVCFMAAFGVPPYEVPCRHADRRYRMIAEGRTRELLRVWGMLDRLSESGIELISLMMRERPDARIALADILNHPYLADHAVADGDADGEAAAAAAAGVVDKPAAPSAAALGAAAAAAAAAAALGAAAAVSVPAPAVVVSLPSSSPSSAIASDAGSGGVQEYALRVLKTPVTRHACSAEEDQDPSCDNDQVDCVETEAKQDMSAQHSAVAINIERACHVVRASCAPRGSSARPALTAAVGAGAGAGAARVLFMDDEQGPDPSSVCSVVSPKEPPLYQASPSSHCKLTIMAHVAKQAVREAAFSFGDADADTDADSCVMRGAELQREYYPHHNNSYSPDFLQRHAQDVSGTTTNAISLHYGMRSDSDMSVANTNLSD